MSTPEELLFHQPVGRRPNGPHVLRLRAADRHLWSRRLPAERVLAVALVGVEFVINLVFADLPGSTVQVLRAGSLGLALTATSVLFLLGTLAFVTVMLRGRQIPTVPLALYAVGAIPVSLRAFVPEAVLDLGLVVLAVGIAWLAIWLLGRASQIDTWTPTTSSPAVRLPVGV